MVLRCLDVPKLPGLNAIRLRGGTAAANNPVRWPYLAECLYEGKQCGVSGLVMLTGDAYIGQLPNTLCHLADDLAIPLFEQPYSLPMVEVTEAISRAIVWAEHTGREPLDADTLPDEPDRAERFKAQLLAHLLMKPTPPVSRHQETL